MDTTKLIDMISGKRVSSYYPIYVKSQWFSIEEMQEFRIKKLRALIEHCYKNVPYYSEFMRKNDIHPNDVKDLSILEFFPIVNKELIKENYEQFQASASSQIKGAKTGQTGGTTGNILYKKNDANTRSSIWATYKRFYDWMGVGTSDLNLSFWGGHVVSHGHLEAWKKKLSDYLTHSISFNAYDTKPETLEKLIVVLKTKDIRLIRSYPQALYSLAKLLEKRDLHFQIQSIMTTSEPLMPQQRVLFKQVFGADSFDQYGCGEIGGIAYECNAHEGLHVTEERVILESNDKDELLITDLDNYIMPFIRYWNADQAVFADHECSCGRKSRLIEKVMGRTCDYLVGVNGQVLHWAYFWHLLFDTNIAINRSFVKFQIVQKETDRIVFRTVSDPLSQADKDTLVDMIKGKMGDMRVEFVLEDNIENSASGKYRPVINEVL